MILTKTLRKEVEEGAPAEVFISADTDWMDYLAAKSLIVREGEPLPFAAALGALRKAVRDGQLPRLRDLASALGAAPLDPRIVSRLDPLGSALADIDSPEDLETPSPR